MSPQERADSLVREWQARNHEDHETHPRHWLKRRIAIELETVGAETVGAELLSAFRALVAVVAVLPENASGTVQGQDLNRAYRRASNLLEALGVPAEVEAGG